MDHNPEINMGHTAWRSSVEYRRVWSESRLVRYLIGAGVLTAASWAARLHDVGPTETRIFRRLNGDVGLAERPIWTVMQFGNGLVAVAAPLTMRALGKPWSDAARAGVAAAGGWRLAKFVKEVVPRERPARLLDGVALRDGDPQGRGFVSGHATVAMSTALAVAPSVGLPAASALLVSAVAVGVARVHVGAHLPLDVVGAFGLATIWGTACASTRKGPS